LVSGKLLHINTNEPVKKGNRTELSEIKNVPTRRIVRAAIVFKK
jgi:hypothetical protein